jgi:hypothetical protein
MYEHIYNYNVIKILVSEEITHSKNFNLLKLAILQRTADTGASNKQ